MTLSSNIQIRAATASDLDTILRFEQGVVAAERPFNDKLKNGEVHYYDVADLIARDSSRVLVAEDSGQLVATGHASIRKSLDYLEHEYDAYLGLMYVDPAYRGQGIIQAIIAELLQWSRSQGVADFYLDVYADNESAVRAYEKFGFQASVIEMKLHDK
jgi:GNAT superfamily N-acetyltransferase